MSTGTLSDKISALTLSVQESPLHNMKALESLLGLARKRSRDQAVNVLGALKDLFGSGNLLPTDRRLNDFASQPMIYQIFSRTDTASWTPGAPLPNPLKEAHLIFWAYEDWLKAMYFQVLQILETWSNDEVAFARGKAVEYISQLLREKPEQEANLLRLLVNKLGDMDKKVASKASYQILQLQIAHPLMKATIINAMEADLLFRPGQSLHAQYFAAITLNQTVLSAKIEDIARKLLDIYFTLFKKLLETPEFRDDVANPVKINKKGQIQGGGGTAGKKVLKKQKMNQKSTIFENDLREKLLSAVLTGINRAVPYINTTGEYFDDRLDTLFRITHSSNFNTSIQALMLIQQVTAVRMDAQDRFYRVLYESLLDPRLLTSSKHALYLNLLYKSLKGDVNADRVQSFAKRLLQISANNPPPFACGVLYLVHELKRTFPSLNDMIVGLAHDQSDDEETFRDAEDGANARSDPPSISQKTSSLISKGVPRSKYDPHKRDPVYAAAKDAPLWELHPMLQHYHPSVGLFSQKLISREQMPPIPDLQQNTLIHFLDRFAFKNPKASHAETAKGISVMQPMAAARDGAVLVTAFSGASRAEKPVYMDAFRQQESSQVAPDEAFFHQYFNSVDITKDNVKQRKEKKDRRRGKAYDSDDGSQEDEIWQALVDSKTEIEGDDDAVDLDSDGTNEELELAIDDSKPSDMEMEDPDAAGSEQENTDLGLDDQDSDLFSSESSDLEDSQDDRMLQNRQGSEARRRDKRKLRGLPTFADAAEYATMLKNDEQ